MSQELIGIIIAAIALAAILVSWTMGTESGYCRPG